MDAARGIIPLLLLAVLLAGGAPAIAQAPPGDDGAGPCDPDTENCEDRAPDPDSELGPAAAVEEDPAIEASAEEEFTPADEISEDYPIPLPSDI